MHIKMCFFVCFRLCAVHFKPWVFSKADLKNFRLVSTWQSAADHMWSPMKSRGIPVNIYHSTTIKPPLNHEITTKPPLNTVESWNHHQTLSNIYKTTMNSPLTLDLPIFPSISRFAMAPGTASVATPASRWTKWRSPIRSPSHPCWRPSLDHWNRRSKVGTLGKFDKIVMLNG